MAEPARAGAASQTPAFTLKVGGTEINQSRPGGIDFLSVEDHCDMIGVAEFTIQAGHDVAFGDVSLGLEVEVALHGSGAQLFKGHVVELRHAMRQGRNTLTVLAMDPLCKLAATRAVETWEDTTDSDVANAVIGSCGATAGQVDATSATHPFVMQRNESGLHFLRRLAARNGFLLKARDGAVDFCAPQFSESPIAVAQSALVSLDYTISSQSIPKALTVYGWDYVAKEKVEGTAAESDIETIGQGTTLGGSEGIWLEQSYLSDVLVTSQAVATDLAKAELDRMSRNFLRGRAVIDGDARFRAGTRVRFEGFEAGFAPDAFVVSTRHRVTAGSGYITEIAFCSNVRA